MKSPRGTFDQLVWLAVVLVLGMVAVFIAYVAAEKDLDRKNLLLQTSMALSDELRDSSDNLTRMVRTHAVTGDPFYADSFRKILAIREGTEPPRTLPGRVYWELGAPDPSAPRVSLIDRMRAAGVTDEELAVFASGKLASDNLTQTEFRAMEEIARMEAGGGGDLSRRLEVIRTLYGKDYQAAKLEIMGALAEGERMVRERTSRLVSEAMARATQLRALFIGLGTALILVLAGISRSLRDILGGPVGAVQKRIREIGVFDESGRAARPGDAGKSVMDWLDYQQRHLLAISEERMRMHAESEAHRLQFQTIFEQAPIGIAIIDSHTGRIQMVNPKFGEIIGRDPAGVAKLDGMAITHPDDIEPDQANMRRMNAGEIPGFSMEKRYFHSNGSVIWINMTIVPLREEAPHQSCHLCMIEDISVRKKQDTDLRRAMRDAEAASIAKDHFLAGVSHEIRTPINGILGLTGILLESPLGPEERESLETVHTSAKTLLDLVNDLLDFAKIEARKLEIAKGDFDLRELIDSVFRAHLAAANARGLDLKLSIAGGLPGWVSGDPLRLRQILNNLLSNAVKFTDAGSVELAVCAVEGHPGRLRFSVTDTGIGIAPDQTGRLFQKFTQLDSSSTRRYGGTGLGLCISQQLAGLMGGKIGVESAPGCGSCFSFDLPFPTAKPPPEPATEPKGPGAYQPLPPELTEGALVLVAEDNATNRLVLMHHLKSLGLAAREVVNGAEAVEELPKAPFTLVLMDLQMPELSGLEAVQKIRDPNSPVPDHSIPVIAVTANALQEERERCLTAGMNGYLIKPYTRNELEAAIRPSLEARRWKGSA